MKCDENDLCGLLPQNPQPQYYHVKKNQTNPSGGTVYKLPELLKRLRVIKTKEKLSQPRGAQGDVTTKFSVLAALLEQEKDTK